RSQVAGRAAVAAAVAILVTLAAGGPWQAGTAALAGAARAVAPHGLASWTIAGDVQGALPLLPGYQLGLLAGLWIALSPFRRAARLALALGALALAQVALLVALGESAAHTGFA